MSAVSHMLKLHPVPGTFSKISSTNGLTAIFISLGVEAASKEDILEIVLLSSIFILTLRNFINDALELSGCTTPLKEHWKSPGLSFRMYQTITNIFLYFANLHNHQF
jgi:type III secretory pathway component EscU